MQRKIGVAWIATIWATHLARLKNIVEKTVFPLKNRLSFSFFGTMHNKMRRQRETVSDCVLLACKLLLQKSYQCDEIIFISGCLCVYVIWMQKNVSSVCWFVFDKIKNERKKHDSTRIQTTIAKKTEIQMLLRCRVVSSEKGREPNILGSPGCTNTFHS